MGHLVAKGDAEWMLFTYGPAELRLERFRSKGDDIWCERRVSWTGEPFAGVLAPMSRINLTGSRAFTKSECEDYARQAGEEWTREQWWQFFTLAKEAAIERFRSGDPLIDLGDIELDDSPPLLLPPLLERPGPVVMAAPGGSVKSYLALACAASVAANHSRFLGFTPTVSGPAVYLDWEADESTHRRRLDALCEPLGVPTPRVYYRREVAPLTHTADNLAKQIANIGAALVVVDSKGAASTTGSERDGTADFFVACRRLNAPVLIVDHVSKAAANGKDTLSAYGSIYTENLARMLWLAKRPIRWDDGVTVSWRLTKANNRATGREIHLRATFTARGLEFTQTDKPAAPTGADTGTVAGDIMSVIRERARWSPKELSMRLGGNADTIKRTLRRLASDPEASIEVNGEGQYFYLPANDDEYPDPY